MASASSLWAGDPTLLGTYPSSGSSPNLFYGVALSGGDAYTVTYGYTNANGALRVLAGTSPPVQIRATSAIDGFRKIELGSEAHVLWSYSAAGNWRSGVRIFNKSTLAEYDTDDRLFWIGTRAQGFHLAGNILYVGSDDGLIAIDVTDPDVEAGEPASGPHVLGICTNITTGYDVDVVGSLAYVADGTAGLKILDVSNPVAPVLLGTWLPGAGKSVRGVFVADAIAYAVGEGFWTVDVSVSGTPVTLGALDEDADRVVAANGFAYLAGYGGLRVYNVNDPATLSLDGRHMTPYRAEDVAYAAPFVYLADRSGLIVLQHGTAPALILTMTAAPDAGSTPLNVRFTAEVTGGAPGYFYDWFIDNQLVYSGEEAFLDHTFDTAEAHVARATVTDASGKVASAAAEVDARGPKGRIYGTVRTAGSGEPIGNASLTVQGSGGVLVAADTVNPAGEYSFANLKPGIYRVTASAPDHEPGSTAVALRPGQNQRVDFNLAALLTDGAKQKKSTLINELSHFPDGLRDWDVGDIIGWINSGSTPTDPVLEHPYAEAEQLTATWLAQQTNLTEALQRITLAEGAFKLMADDAAIYANYAAEYYASAMGNTLDMMICLFQLDELIKEKLWFTDIQGLLIEKYTKALSFDLFLKLAQWTGERSTLAARTIFRESLNEIIGAMADEAEIDINVNQFVLDWKARFENYWAQSLIEEYGRATEPLLTTALDRAIAGPPYDLDYEDSKAIVLNELRATAAKRELVVRHQNNIDYVAEEIAGAGASTFGWLNTIIDACGECLPEAGLAHCTELAFRSLQIYGEVGNAQMALDRLRVGLPQEAANAVYWSFGATPPSFPPAGAVADPELRVLGKSANDMMGISSMSLPAPSSAAARAALTTAHGQLDAVALAAYATTLTNGVIPEMDAYVHESGIFYTAANFQLDPASPELKEVCDHLGWCRDSYHFVLAASLELIMHNAAGNPLDEPAAVALRTKLLDQIATLIATLNETDRTLNAAHFATGDRPDPGPILAITGLSATNAAGHPYLPAVADQTIAVTAEVSSVGSSNATGVQISLVLTNTSNLSLAGGSLTVPLPPLPAGAATNITWTLTCGVAGHKRFELLTCSLAHTGSDLSTTLPQGESFLIVPGPYYTDSDGDGISDTFETDNGLNPGDPADAQSDVDGDGLSALDEFLNHTNPNAADTDGDGFNDPNEIAGGYNPFDPASHPVPTPHCDQLEIGMFDAAGIKTPLLIARFLKPDPETPITVQGSTNLIEWENILVYSNGASAINPAVYQFQEFDGHFELLFDVPGLQPTLPRAAFYRMAWKESGPAPYLGRVTFDPGTEYAAKWDPVGERIAYVTLAVTETYQLLYRLGMVDSDSENEHVAATGDPAYGTLDVVRNPVWIGAAGKLLVEERVGTREILEFDPAMDGFVRIIADGNDAAFTRRLLIDGAGKSGAICVSRNGSTVAWRYQGATGDTNIYLRVASYASLSGQNASSHGTAFLEVAPSSDRPLDDLNRGMALNSDGTVAIVSRQSGAGLDLWRYNTDGSGTPVQLTTSGQTRGALNMNPEFSPNGQRIVFTTQELSEALDIMVINTNGTGLTNATASPDYSEVRPTWSPDGGRLAFERYDDEASGFLQPGESPNWNIHVIAVP